MILLVQFEIKQTSNICSTSIQYTVYIWIISWIALWGEIIFEGKSGRLVKMKIILYEMFSPYLFALNF